MQIRGTARVWRAGAIAFSLAVGALVWLLATQARPASALQPCTDVQIVGLRGSHESLVGAEHDMGSLLGPVADKIATQVQEAGTVSFYGLPYPAQDASIGTVLDGSYFASKHAGSAMLHDYLAAETAACPATRLVVMGYSQGAHAAGDQLALEPPAITDHVAAFVMFGDPRFNPEASYVWGTFDPRDHGLAGPRSLGDFASWSGHVFSFCNHNDLICQGIGFDHGTDAHDQARYVDAWGDLVAGLVRRRLGYPKPAGAHTPLDLAFVLDSTGSMSDSIAGVEDAAATIVQTLHDQGADFHVGLVDYKDTDQGDPYASQVDLDMTSDADAFAQAVHDVEADGGGDEPEAVYSGLMTAIDDLSWRSVTRKAIIVMGDAPAKDPEPLTGFTHESVLAAARDLDPATIDPVAVGEGPLESFQPLADGSGGQLFPAAEPSQVSEEVVAAVGQIAVPIYTSLTVASPARPGTSVAFSAAGSYYDDGDIVSYAWDFDGDGTPDATTTDNRTAHVYDDAFEGIASVTVTTDDDKQATTTAEVDVRPDAPVPPGTPQQLSADGASGALSLAWHPPADAGSDAIAGYQVEIDDATGARVAAAAVDASVTRATIAGLTPGRYVAHVSAANEAGAGPAADAGADVVLVPAGGPSPGAPAPGSSGSVARRAAGASVRVRALGWHGRTLRLRLRCPRASASTCRVRLALRADGSRRRLAVTSLVLPRGGADVAELTIGRAATRRLRRGSIGLTLLVRTSTTGGVRTATLHVHAPKRTHRPRR